MALLVEGLITSAYIGLWIALSSSVILFNKWILDGFGFPFPVALTMIHMLLCSALAYLLVKVLKVVEGVSMTMEVYLRKILPVALLFSIVLWLGNSAYIYLSVAFIQMVKALMPCVVYLIGLMFRVETFNSTKMLNMTILTVGIAIASYGEVNFHAFGFLLLLLSIGAEAIRLVSIQVLLASSDIKLNSVTTLYYVSPACVIFLVPPFVYLELPSLLGSQDIHLNPMVLLSSAVLAFGLNISVYLLIGKTSALTMNVAGVLKDWILITISSVLFDAPISMLQLCGYLMAFAAVCFYNYKKCQERTASESKKHSTSEICDGNAKDASFGTRSRLVTYPRLVGCFAAALVLESHFEAFRDIPRYFPTSHTPSILTATETNDGAGRAAAFYHSTDVYSRSLVTFICGKDWYWDFLENIAYAQTSWKSESTLSLYTCDEDHFKGCQDRQPVFPKLICRRQNHTTATATNIFKPASILSALEVESATHLLFLDLDIAFKSDVWVDLLPYMSYDMVFSNQAGSDEHLDINIGAILVKRSGRTEKFWQQVVEQIQLNGGWDQQVVADNSWGNTDISFALFPTKVFTPFGFGYPAYNISSKYEDITALHGVCGVIKFIFLKEAGFWSDVHGYYSNPRAIQLVIPPGAFSELSLSAYLAYAISVAKKCDRRVVLPGKIHLGDAELYYYELWNLEVLVDIGAPILEPSYMTNALRTTGRELQSGAVFTLDEHFLADPPCSEVSSLWTLRPNVDFLKVADASRTKEDALFYCGPPMDERARLPCQPEGGNSTHCVSSESSVTIP